jgi:hypothetical protein
MHYRLPVSHTARLIFLFPDKSISRKDWGFYAIGDDWAFFDYWFLFLIFGNKRISIGLYSVSIRLARIRQWLDVEEEPPKKGGEGSSLTSRRPSEERLTRTIECLFGHTDKWQGWDAHHTSLATASSPDHPMYFRQLFKSFCAQSTLLSRYRPDQTQSPGIFGGYTKTWEMRNRG